MKLSIKDMNKISLFTKNDPIGRLLHIMNTDWQFSVNDVLIRFPYTNISEPEMVSPICPVPKKYRVVHIDKCGMRWIKYIKVDGSEGALVALSEVWQDGKWVFAIGPEQVDAIMLGIDYDPLEQYNKHYRDDRD